MRQNVIHLEQFYASRLGRAAQDMAGRRLSKLWPSLAGKDVLGYGYTWPYLSAHSDEAGRIVLAMPGEQGALAQTSRRGVVACLTEGDLLPFSDASFDYVFVAHAVEETQDLQSLFAELWRVTRPEGRIVVLASNRAGLWARSDSSPFGSGRPFSRKQLRAALRDARFIPTVWSGALFVPPIKFLVRPQLTHGFERFGETVWPSFSGVVLVEALKRLYAEPSGTKARLVRRPNFGGTVLPSPAASREVKRDI
ncbi:MAG: class I SAM-dependent methyltransferase [Maricaulaceae bacterium]